MSQLKLFIIDDDPVFSEMLKDYISEKSRWQVFSFECGEDCLKQIHLDPEVIIIDYNLDNKNPDALNGMETMAEIKKKTPEAHCIFLSGQESYGVALQTISHGAESYILKDESTFDELGKILDGIPVS